MESWTAARKSKGLALPSAGPTVKLPGLSFGPVDGFRPGNDGILGGVRTTSFGGVGSGVFSPSFVIILTLARFCKLLPRHSRRFLFPEVSVAPAFSDADAGSKMSNSRLLWRPVAAFPSVHLRRNSCITTLRAGRTQRSEVTHNRSAFRMSAFVGLPKAYLCLLGNNALSTTTNYRYRRIFLVMCNAQSLRTIGPCLRYRELRESHPEFYPCLRYVRVSSQSVIPFRAPVSVCNPASFAMPEGFAPCNVRPFRAPVSVCNPALFAMPEGFAPCKL